MAYTWDARYRDEPTKNYLARVLTGAGMLDLAVEAEKGHFDDYFCPAEIDDGMNIHRLVKRLRGRGPEADLIAHAAMNGEFDGTRAEADAWAQTPDGQAAYEQFEQHIKGA